MVKRIVEIVLQLTSIGLVIAAAGLWAGAGVDARPRHRDEQTLVGGAIWSQIIIPIGLMISKIVEEPIDIFVQGYYVVTGICLLWLTSAFLIAHEMQWLSRQHANSTAPMIRSLRSSRQLARNPRVVSSHTMVSQFDRAYYAIGIICFVAGAVKLSELIFAIVKS